MENETHGTPGQHVQRDAGNVVSSDKYGVEEQTGEEFSCEFLRDRYAVRRIPEGDQAHTSRLGFNGNQNHQLGYQDLSGIIGRRTKDSECTEASNFSPRVGYAVEAKSKAYPDNLRRYRLEYGAGEQGSGMLDKFDYNRTPKGSNSPPYFMRDSPKSYHPFDAGVSEASYSGKMKFLCSFGGKILPRPNDGKLRYMGGETRIISIRKNVAWDELAKKTSAICNQPHIIKYQLPGEDLDALISVCSNEDLQHMIEEYHDLERIGGSQRLRLFLEPSAELENPNSSEAKANKQEDSDNQYVTVNGIIDPSPHKSSGGQSLASETTQVGNNSDCSPSFARGSPTSCHALENLANKFPYHTAQLLPTLDISKDSFSQWPSLSVVTSQHRDPMISNFQLQRCSDDNESTNPFVTDKLPRDGSYYVESSSYYTNPYHGHLALTNYQHNEYFPENDHLNNQCVVNFSNPNRDFMPSQLCGKDDMKSENTIHNEKAFQSGNLVSHCKDPVGLLSTSNDKADSYQKMVHARSDSQLHEHDEKFNTCLDRGTPALSFINTDRERSPSLRMSSSLLEFPAELQQMLDEKRVAVKVENRPTFQTPDFFLENHELSQEISNWRGKNNDRAGREWNHYEENSEVKLNSNTVRCNNFPHMNHIPGLCLSNKELEDSEGPKSSSPVILLENDAKNMKDHYYGYQVETTEDDVFHKGQEISKDQHRATNKIDNQPVSHASLKLLCVTSKRVADQETIFPNYRFTLDVSPGREVPFSDQKVMEVALDEEKSEESFSVQSQPSIHCQENGELQSVAIVEDISQFASPDVFYSSRVIPHVQYESTDELSTSRETIVNIDPESDCNKDTDGDNKNIDESISDAAIAELEAGIYGLQIIKNADLEELQELGCGTFGTVYHGKWRGTDVAIKRIKKSCFAGRSSEQERLTKDFWREARILSNLHHPNVLAFYGVVPDGPGGTLATVTEYMVNGSLSHVLQRKDRSLDRRKRLMIALDAAFGMEYLHLKNIVHFDLKCDNLLVNLRDRERPVCKVGDFGLSRIKCNTLVSGGVRGTLPWMAPELLNGSSSKVSEKVDVYSFGMAMWEIVTGDEPYANMHCGAIIGGIVNNTLRPPIPENCDLEWRKLMEECWSPDPSVRPSFTEITNRLRVMSMALQTKRRNRPNR